MKYLLGIVTVLLFTIGCNFSEYAQSENLAENIDSHRTGCEIDTAGLMAGYKQYDANQLYFNFSFSLTPEPTPTPGPITDTEILTSALLEQVWEHGCQTGRRDAAGAQQATLMGLRDQLNILDSRISAMEPTPTPTAAPTGPAGG